MGERADDIEDNIRILFSSNLDVVFPERFSRTFFPPKEKPKPKPSAARNSFYLLFIVFFSTKTSSIHFLFSSLMAQIFFYESMSFLYNIAR